MQPIFITGIGTGIGKTLVSAIITEALHADYWKPVQAGFSEGTDNLRVQELLTNNISKVHEEAYKFKMAASPHIASRTEGVKIDLDHIKAHYKKIALTAANDFLVIEGAGGLMVPLNKDEFVVDLIKKLDAKVILVSRNYLGSINHSLLIAQTCKAKNLKVLGWVFNDQYLNYEDDIVQWSGYKKIASIPFVQDVDASFVKEQAALMKENLLQLL